MKPGYRNLLSVLGAIGLAMPFTGCESDAEEAGQGGSNSTASSAVGAGTPVDAGKAATNPISATSSGDPASKVELSGSASAGTVSSNQQTLILNRIPPTQPSNVKLSKGVEEIVKLAQSGVSETVLLLFIEKSVESFELDASDIIYLNDIGISSTVLASMLNHDGQGEDVLHDALGTNNTQVATASPPPQPAASAPTMEVSSNYVAAPQYNGTAVAQSPAVLTQPAVAEQQAVVVQQPAVVVTQPAVTYSYFYSSLAPYGSWVEIPDYGWCWQPTIATAHYGWRPYVHGGRWLSSDVGWYWHSDYSWGWAPFHYGRWYCAPRAGWVWVPDYTWGPSWVTWRSSGAYCGWAPLPPRSRIRPGFGFSYWGHDVGFGFGFGYTHDYYTFVPTGRFCDRRVIDHVVHTDRTVNIYKDSTVVNNYIVGNNNTIINNGIGRDYVASHTRSELPRVRVQDAPNSNIGMVQPDRPQRVGSETVVYRPNRPSSQLVAAHDAAVARTRNESARPTDSNFGVTRNIAPNRDAVVGVSAGGAASRPGGASVSRNETARSQIASRGPESAVFGTPAPLRPEPDRSREILRSRSNQESLARRPITSSANVGSAAPTSTSSSARGGATPIFTRPGSIASGNVGSPQAARPGQSTTSPSYSQPRSEPARSPDLVNPRQSTTQGTISRPAPATAQPATPVARGSANWSRPSQTQQGTVTTTPQTIQRSSPSGQTAPAPAARPNVIRRSESYSRSSSPVQSTPPPPVVQPRSVSPAPSVRQTPVARPQTSAPSAPVTRSAPSVTSRPAPASRGSYRSAPPAAAARPSAVQSGNSGNSSGGRGRVEIGR